jgi:D-sedoheptulose 7-phosphate isomerase
MKELIDRNIGEHQKLVETVKTELAESIGKVAERLVDCIRGGNTVFWCGNGGSASDAQHLAAELVGRFVRERRALPSIALTANTSTLTSIGNDYGFDHVFSRQVEGLVREGDVVVGISTSGNSPNVLAALEAARKKGAVPIGLLGRDGGKIAPICLESIVIPATDTARVQEMHIMIGHILCGVVESECAEENR